MISITPRARTIFPAQHNGAIARNRYGSHPDIRLSGLLRWDVTMMFSVLICHRFVKRENARTNRDSAYQDVAMSTGCSRTDAAQGAADRACRCNVFLSYARIWTNLELQITGSLVISGRPRCLAVAAIKRSCSSRMSSIWDAVLRISRLRGSN